MQSFQDTAGREWQLDLHVGNVKAVKDATGVLLTKLFDNNAALYLKITENLFQLVDVLWALTRGQHPEVTADQFAESLGGDALGHAIDAIGYAVIDFFPNQERRNALRGAMDAANKTATQLAVNAQRTVESLDINALVNACTSSATSLPASQASTLGGTPSVN